MERGGGNGKRKRKWKRGARIERGSGIELRVGGNERGGWKGMLDIFTPRRLRGGVKIRGGEFLGGGEVPNIIGNTPPPATASRSHPPPQAAEGKKNTPIPAQAGISRFSNCLLASHSKTIRMTGRFPLSREWKGRREWKGGAGMEKGSVKERGGRGWKRGRESRL